MKSVLIFIALVIIGGAGYLLYLDYHKPETSAQNLRPEPIALLENKENDVQRKASTSANWEGIEVLGPLFSGDEVKTQKGSSAHIKTNDGSVIQVRENSLVGLERTPVGLALDLKGGDIFSQNAASTVEFSTRGAIIKGDLADLHLTTDLSGKSHLEISKGKVSVLDKLNKRLDLAQNQSADLNDGVLLGPKAAGTPAPILAKVPAAPPSPPSSPPSAKNAEGTVDLLKPESGRVMNLEPENDSIEFDWSAILASKFYVLEVSTTSDFKKIIQSHTVYATKDVIKDLKAQNYFWRVRAFDSKNKPMATSKSNSFNLKIKMQNLPELVTPGAEITWSDPTPIDFTWKKTDAAKYRISIYTDLSQRNEVKSEVTEGESFSWLAPSPKSYYWTVKGLNTKGTVISQSEVRHLTIAGAPKGKQPTFVIINPKDQTEVTRDLTIEKPDAVTFQWRVTKPLPGPLSLIISTDPEFTDPLTIKNVTKAIVPVTLKKEGIYYWNLSSQSEDGRDLELSPVVTFNLKSTGSLTTPKIIEPLNETKLESEDPRPVKFAWKPVKNAVNYHFVLKKVDAKTKESFIVLDRTVKETTLTTDPLEAGDYTWNVFGHDSKDREKGLEQEYTLGLNSPSQADSPKLKEPVVK